MNSNPDDRRRAATMADLPTLGEAGAAGRFTPGAVEVRLIGPAADIDAADRLLADLAGRAWKPGARTRSRHEGGGILLRGTLTVPLEDR